ncbi:MAG: MotA/TolQ/ExbB proton channel family protein [Candidatus Caenarcaniphilales bacterium]|nr:MotA/TolQ/ExbB proton channel family protein [Candidatus Caenarcaniphilales bacterium]
MPESQNNVLLTYFIEFFVQDWFASIPIAFCGIITLAVAIDRAIYYSRNQRDLGSFIRRIQIDLEQGNIDNAINLSKQVGGLIGLMTEEGLRLMKHHTKNFSSAFDISASLYVRDLEKRLPALATIGATAPFLGLFGTVVGVIVTLKILGESGGQSQAVVIGVAKALIATGFGLIVAIFAVILNNWFNSMVRSFENDFQVIKLTILDFINSQATYSTSQEALATGNPSSAQYYASTAPQQNNPQPNIKQSYVRPQARVVPNPQQEGGSQFNSPEYY